MRKSRDSRFVCCLLVGAARTIDIAADQISPLANFLKQYLALQFVRTNAKRGKGTNDRSIDEGEDGVRGRRAAARGTHWAQRHGARRALLRWLLPRQPEAAHRILHFVSSLLLPLWLQRVDDTTTEEQDAAVGRRAAGAGGLAALRRRKDKKKKDSERDVAADQPAQRQLPEDNAAALQDADGEDREDELVEPRALTKKELAKEMKKREREEMRRFEEQRREELKKKNEAKEEALQKKREEDAKLEQAKEEEALRLQEEKAKQEQEEFDKWKNMFVVEEEGSRLAEDSEESQNLLQQFVDYIKSHKVVLLEDLAAEFNMATQDAIQRVEALQKANRITGIIDDRGKFIYITDEEMDKVVKYIQRKGRMALSELSKECNKLIRLEGEHASDATLAVDWLNEDAPADQQQEGKDASA